MKYQKTTVLLSVMFFISIPLSQSQEKESALKKLQTRPQIEVSINQPLRTVHSGMDIYVRATNLTDWDIIINKVEIYMAREFLAARGEINKLESESPQKNEEHLVPGGEHIYHFPITHRDLPIFSVLLNYHLLAFMPGEYEFRIIVNYSSASPGSPAAGLTPSSSQIISKIYLEPPMTSIMWGGIIGVILLSLFVGIYRFRRAKPDRSFWEAAKEALILAAAGSVSAIITVILLFRFKDLDLPINITANDFFGGIVIGLFTYKIGDWLYDKLFGQAKTKGREKKSNNSDVAQAEEKPL